MWPWQQQWHMLLLLMPTKSYRTTSWCWCWSFTMPEKILHMPMVILYELLARKHACYQGTIKYWLCQCSMRREVHSHTELWWSTANVNVLWHLNKVLKFHIVFCKTKNCVAVCCCVNLHWQLQLHNDKVIIKNDKWIMNNQCVCGTSCCLNYVWFFFSSLFNCVLTSWEVLSNRKRAIMWCC